MKFNFDLIFTKIPSKSIFRFVKFTCLKKIDYEKNPFKAQIRIDKQGLDYNIFKKLQIS